MAWKIFVEITSTDEGSSGNLAGSSLIMYVSPRASRMVNFGVIPESGRPVTCQMPGAGPSTWFGPRTTSSIVMS